MTAQHKPLSTLYIPEARYITPEGETQWVVPALKDEAIAPGRVAYDHDIHHLKLKCSHCSVRIDFNKGAGIAAAGTQIKGARPHLKTAPGQAHEAACTLPDVDNHVSNSQFDKTLGYRLHLNTIFTAADARRPVYTRGADGRVVASDERLLPRQEIRKDADGHDIKVRIYREALALHTAQDFIDLMRRGEFARLRDSFVVNNTVIPWEDFAILNRKRLRNLVDRLLNGASHPVLMKIALYEPAEERHAESSAVFYKRDDRGPHFILPRVYLDGKGAEAAFPVRGEYLILGLPRVKVDERSGTCFLNISLKTPENAAPFFYDDVVATGEAQQAKRLAAPAP